MSSGNGDCPNGLCRSEAWDALSFSRTIVFTFHIAPSRAQSGALSSKLDGHPGHSLCRLGERATAPVLAIKQMTSSTALGNSVWVADTELKAFWRVSASAWFAMVQETVWRCTAQKW